MKFVLLLLLAFIAATLAHADTPAFDRPGIAFSTQTLPAGAATWEQGLPDLAHDNDQGAKVTQYSADTRIRVGLTSSLELQAADALYNRQRTRIDDVTTADHGPGDLTLALKLALPSTRKVSWALLGGVSLATGNTPFTTGTQQYQLAGSASMHLDDAHALGLYAGVTREGKDNAYTLSPNFSFPVGANLGGYVEAGYTFGDHIDKNEVAGGGLAWMVNSTVQLDLYALRGLTSLSTDLQAGFGVSIYWP